MDDIIDDPKGDEIARKKRQAKIDEQIAKQNVTHYERLEKEGHESLRGVAREMKKHWQKKGL